MQPFPADQSWNLAAVSDALRTRCWNSDTKLLRWMTHRRWRFARPSFGRDESALEVLSRRYAAGELTDEEFDAKRRRLEGGSS